MTKEDQDEFERNYGDIRVWQYSSKIWEAACAYKDKRIAELEAGIRNELNTIKGAACYADSNSAFVITQAVQVIYGLLSEGGGTDSTTPAPECGDV